jgi:hypothetical protein
MLSKSKEVATASPAQPLKAGAYAMTRRTWEYTDELDELNRLDKSKEWWEPVQLYDYSELSGAPSYLGRCIATAPEEGLDPVATIFLRAVLKKSDYTERMKDAIWCAFTMPKERKKNVARYLGVDYQTLRVYLNRVRVKIGELGGGC